MGSKKSRETLLELAIEAASNLPFEVVDGFFGSRGQVCPDELAIKCANATLPSKNTLMALYDGVLDVEYCQCEKLKDLRQTGFTVFATWTCAVHGCGLVRAHWAQKKLTSFQCNCPESATSLYFCRHVLLIMLRRINTTPDFIKSPPISNILMNLNLEQLQEVLVEIVSWDTSGKDIFDCDYMFRNPVKGIPDLTISEYDGEEKVDWLRSNPSVRSKSAEAVAKILLAAKDQRDIYRIAFSLLKNQAKLLDANDTIYDMLVALSLLYLFTTKYGHAPQMKNFIKELTPLIPQTLLNHYKDFVLRWEVHRNRSLSNEVDIEVTYLDILFNTLECIRCPVTDKIRSNRNVKISMHTLDQLIYRFSAYQSNLNSKKAKLRPLPYSDLHAWHRDYLETVLTVGQLLFNGVSQSNVDLDIKFPR